MRSFLLVTFVGAFIVGVSLWSNGVKASVSRELEQAALDGRVDDVRRLLAAGADPNEPGVDGLTPLLHAASAGQLDAVALLLAHGAVIPPHVSFEKNPVLARRASAVGSADLAFAGGNDAVRRLLALVASDFPSGVTLYGPIPESGSLLFRVAVAGDVDVARALVDAGFPVEESRALDGMGPLSGAAIAGSAPIAKLLLAKGASVATRTHFDRTPLHHAALAGVGDIVEHVLAAGADPSVADQLGWTALHYAALCGHGLAVRAFAAPAAAAHCIDARDPFGWTPLMRAVAGGSIEAVDALLANGADVHAASTSARTALHIAAERGFDDVYERLVAAGASEDARDSFDSTPRELRLHVELPFGNPGALELDEPIAHAAWLSRAAHGVGEMEFAAWEDGVVIFSDFAPSYPWTTFETLCIGRIPAVRARRLSVELEESTLFRHLPASTEPRGSRRYVARCPTGAAEESFQISIRHDPAEVDWRHQSETDVTLGRLWLDAQAILASARPALTAPLSAHLVEAGSMRSFRHYSWSGE